MAHPAPPPPKARTWARWLQRRVALLYLWLRDLLLRWTVLAGQPERLPAADRGRADHALLHKPAVELAAMVQGLTSRACRLRLDGRVAMAHSGSIPVCSRPHVRRFARAQSHRARWWMPTLRVRKPSTRPSTPS